MLCAKKRQEYFMDAISYTKARNQLARTMETVCSDHAPVIVTRQNAQSVVIMSLADYTAIEETAYLLRSPANAALLAKAVADIEVGNAQERVLTE